MNSMLSRLRESVSAFMWQALIWTIIAAVVLALAACVYFFGFWKTFVGAILISIWSWVYEANSNLAEIKRELRLTQDLVKGPPRMRTIPASELGAGMYLYGRYLVCGVDALDNERIMAHPEKGTLDSPWFFDRDRMIEVTDRPLSIYQDN